LDPLALNTTPHRCRSRYLIAPEIEPDFVGVAVRKSTVMLADEKLRDVSTGISCAPVRYRGKTRRQLVLPSG